MEPPVDSNPAEKRLIGECIDRLSNLPDPILGHILSYVPTKNAVATSILSTRWKNLFPFGVPPINIDLDDTLLLNPRRIRYSSTYRRFSEFVDKLLNETLRDVPCVEIMILSCKKKYGDEKVISWVSAALRLNVRHLLLRSAFMSNSVTLFHTFDGCTTIKKLELGRNFDLYLPGNFTLPNLIKLTLDHLVFHEDTESIQELLDGCPMLEYLAIEGCDLVFMDTLSIRCPLLEELVIEECFEASGCELVIEAPNLTGLFYVGNVAGDYYVNNFKSLNVAHIDVGPSPEELEEAETEGKEEEEHWYFDCCVGKLINSCSSVHHLYLSDASIAALQRLSFQLPTFQNLIDLALGCMGIYGWKLLACLLKSAPNLEKLVIEEGFNEYEGGFESFKSSLPSLPICLELNVKKIKFRYFLKNGKVLQNSTISPFLYEYFAEIEYIADALKDVLVCFHVITFGT
ncbi:hypothetical protein RD792_008871 [Penstemon davidsonii]|uniref:F-box domain-containing protein n=1 Tax=Penstemon davidsonii TaxID=160366 RepID=A0ABR0DAB7_9LAMI|nr:hypothetical protein RD792_008871 [Penstemon davidsonii]